jgi:hypothetical protein
MVRFAITVYFRGYYPMSEINIYSGGRNENIKTYRSKAEYKPRTEISQQSRLYEVDSAHKF